MIDETLPDEQINSIDPDLKQIILSIKSNHTTGLETDYAKIQEEHLVNLIQKLEYIALRKTQLLTKSIKYDPLSMFDFLGLKQQTPQETFTGWQRPSDFLISQLQAFKVPNPEKLSFGQAQRLVTNLIKRRNKHLCSPAQMITLLDLGVNLDTLRIMSTKEASDKIHGLLRNSANQTLLVIDRQSCLSKATVASQRDSIVTTDQLDSQKKSLELERKSLGLELLNCLADKIIYLHLNTLSRKRKQCIHTDDYGREILDKWDTEMSYFITNILIPSVNVDCEIISQSSFTKANYELINEFANTTQYWFSRIEACIMDHQESPKNNFNPEFSGHDYEYFVAELIQSTGVTTIVTKGSGDHGADIIAEFNNFRVAIQCKKYESSVGNKSVQEAFSAAGFYDCKTACVVSNAIFTTAAKQAASKLGVSLLHHDEVGEYFASLKSKLKED